MNNSEQLPTVNQGPTASSTPTSPSTPAPPHALVRNINEAHKEGMSRGETLALFITQHVGTMGFFSIILIWTILWLGWNTLAPDPLKFDPPTGFVFWLFISNMIQLMLMPLLLIGQNLQGRHAEMATENDYHVNLRAKEEIELLIQRLDKQQALLEAIHQQLAAKNAAPET